MKFLRAIGICGTCLIVALAAGCGKSDTDAGDAAGKSITIWWAQWAPAEGLQELGNEFEKETGIAANVSQIPWQSYQSKVFMNFANKRTDFDIVVGDSQWIGRGATKGLYLELTDWLPKAVDMDAVSERALRYMCEYPAGSGKYFAAPCEIDAIGFAYRKDWFEDAKEKAAFKAKYNRELGVPDTWEEFRDVAEFFHRPDQNRYGCAPLTGRGYDSLTMGFQQIMWTFGGSWGDPDTYQADGHVNSEAAVESLAFLKELLKFAPKGALNLDYGKTLECFKNDTTAMVMDYFAFFPEIAGSMGDKAGFFIMPRKGDRRVVSLGGQGFSISAKVPPEQQELAKKFIAWFLQTDVQRKWITKPAGFTANKLILESEEFRKASPYNEPFAESLECLQDFWNVPQYNELLAVAQKYVGEALDDVKTPKEALDAIAEEHEKIFAEAGLLKKE
jgi:multiple sugar transport system substrate-binding protein